MPNTALLLEQVRRVVPRNTNYAIAKALEMSQSDLSRVFAGKQGLGVKAAVRLSELLRRDLRDIIVLLEEDKATTPHDIEFWGRRSPRITASIAIAAMALGLAVTPHEIRAADIVNTGYISSVRLTDLYIMRSDGMFEAVAYLSVLTDSGPSNVAQGYEYDHRS